MKIRKLMNNIEIKLICLLLAIIMWFYANSSTGIINRARAAISGKERGIITFRNAPIEIEMINTENIGKLILTPRKVAISVSCPLTAEIDASNFNVKVRIAKKDLDRNRIILSEDNVILPPGLNFERSDPEVIYIHPRASSDL
ncbi:MAG: hypothetical protein ACUVWN_03325 [bacterium]